MSKNIMVIFTIFIAATLVTAAYAQTAPNPPPLNEPVDTVATTQEPKEEKQVISGKLTIPVSDKDVLEIDIPYKSGNTYRITTK